VLLGRLTGRGGPALVLCVDEVVCDTALIAGLLELLVRAGGETAPIPTIVACRAGGWSGLAAGGLAAAGAAVGAGAPALGGAPWSAGVPSVSLAPRRASP
jgi:hypothetical protein